MIKKTSLFLMVILFCFSFHSEAMICRGDTGKDVRYVQQLLVERGYLLDQVDGIFGNHTEYAVKAFQNETALQVTGKVDDQTLQKLEEKKTLSKNKKVSTLKNAKQKTSGLVEGLSLGNRSQAVTFLQERLQAHGFSTLYADGIFGKNTEEAVRSFQRIHQLEITGKVDKKTVEALQKEPVKPTSWRLKLIMNASAYTSQDPGNGSYTARGNILRRGLVAVDPKVIPLGTELYIEGYGYAVADDIGGAINGKSIDLAMDSYEEAISFGRRDVVVYILT